MNLHEPPADFFRAPAVLRMLGAISPFHRSSKSHNPLLLPAHFAAFLVASAGAFVPWNYMLLIGNDGEFTRNRTVQFFRFADAIPGLPMAPFEGMGTLFSFNPLLTPSLIPLALLGDTAGKWLGFLICAGLIFLSTYVLGRALGMRRGIALTAAWLLPPLCLPYQSWLNLYLTDNLNPIAGDTVSLSMLLLAFLAYGYTSARPLWPALGVFSIVVWLLLANPLWIVILVPTALPVSIGIMAGHFRQADFVRRTALLVLPSLVLVALGGAPYLLGLFMNTPVGFFAPEMNQNLVHAWRMCTVATAWNKLDPVGASWVGLTLAGLVLVIRREQATLRAAALSVLVAIVLLAAYIAAYWMTPSWVLPYPVYFELALLPFYALFTAYTLAELAAHVFAALSHHYPQVADRLMRDRPAPLQYVGQLILVGAVLGILFASNPFIKRPNKLILPPTDTAISTTLQAESGIAPNAPFRGYAANLTGFKGPNGPPTDWFDILPDSNNAILAFGNTHRVPYLWRYNVATIESYAESIEPAMYGVISRLLDRPDDRQVRNVTLITRTNFPLMESLGVRFLITDYALPEPAHLIVKVVTPTMSHFLFELPDPNYGNYSPTNVISAQDATDVLERIGDPNFNFRKTVVLDEPLDQVLKPVASSNATLVRSGWRLQADSTAASLVLLPLQFSDCLSLSGNRRDGGRVIAVRRANLASTAVVFEGSIDVELKEHVSPFWNPYCRLRDVHDMKEFGLPHLPKIISGAGS